MAGGPLRIKEEIEMCIEEDLMPGSRRQGQDHLMIADTLDHESRFPRVSLRRQTFEPKPALSAVAQPAWNMTSSRTRKVEHQQPVPRMSGQPGQGDAYAQEYPINFQGLFDCNLGIDLLAEIGLEELNGLEMELIRRQLLVITQHLRVLEDQDASWRLKEVVFFTLMVLACIASLWLWLRQ